MTNRYPDTPRLEDMLNPWVDGSADEEPTRLELQRLFEEIRVIEGLEAAFEAFPNWKDFTAEGDPYPIPEPELVRAEEQATARPVLPVPKLVAGAMVDTNDETWLDDLQRMLKEGVERGRTEGPSTEEGE